MQGVPCLTVPSFNPVSTIPLLSHLGNLFFRNLGSIYIAYEEYIVFRITLSISEIIYVGHLAFCLARSRCSTNDSFSYGILHKYVFSSPFTQCDVIEKQYPCNYEAEFHLRISVTTICFTIYISTMMQAGTYSKFEVLDGYFPT